MAIHRLKVQQIISRVKLIFGDAPDAYIMNLINDAQVEASNTDVKKKRTAINSVKNQRYYGIDDADASLSDVNKIYRVDFMNSDGEYIKIPRLINSETKMNDTA